MNIRHTVETPIAIRPPNEIEYLREILAIAIYSQDVREDLPPRAGWTELDWEDRARYRAIAESFARDKL
jgi:hypothetical protein